jgi:hypothetical protein
VAQLGEQQSKDVGALAAAVEQVFERAAQAGGDIEALLDPPGEFFCAGSIRSQINVPCAHGLRTLPGLRSAPNSKGG